MAEEPQKYEDIANEGERKVEASRVVVVGNKGGENKVEEEEDL